MLNDAVSTAGLSAAIASAIRSRNPIAQQFFAVYAEAIAATARKIEQRLSAGGRVYAFGCGAYATDAAHLAVEFVHPVLVGKPALPASDLSASFDSFVPFLKNPDVAVGFGPPDGDPKIERALARAREQGVFTLALPGRNADFAIEAFTDDEHVHQEVVELVGHLLYESVHVFLEHRGLDHDVGSSAFLYPFLGRAEHSRNDLVTDVVESIREKAGDAQALRDRVAQEEAQTIAAAVETIAREVAAGGRLLLFGNGGSATDATDWAWDCIAPPGLLAPIAALSLSSEPATITAIANDVGREFIFLRQLIAQIRPHDVAIGLSTSGGSLNVISALEEARKRGNRTIALLGYDGGEIYRRGLADHAIVVRSDYIPRIQEAQATIYHTMRHALQWLRSA